MEKEIKKIECDNCNKGVVVWDDEKEKFICDWCGALYR